METIEQAIALWLRVIKGDTQGHEFRGNQYTEGGEHTSQPAQYLVSAISRVLDRYKKNEIGEEGIKQFLDNPQTPKATAIGVHRGIISAHNQIANQVIFDAPHKTAAQRHQEALLGAQQVIRAIDTNQPKAAIQKSLENYLSLATKANKSSYEADTLSPIEEDLTKR